MIAAALGLGVVLAAGTPDTGLVARIESLLGTGQLTEARRLAQEAVRRAPDQPAALLALGRTYLEWPLIGRFRAWQLFEDAARRAPAATATCGRSGTACIADRTIVAEPRASSRDTPTPLRCCAGPSC